MVHEVDRENAEDEVATQLVELPPSVRRCSGCGCFGVGWRLRGLSGRQREVHGRASHSRLLLLKLGLSEETRYEERRIVLSIGQG